MEVYVFSYTKIADELYSIDGLERQDYSLLREIYEDLEQEYDVIFCSDYNEGQFKTAAKVVDDITDSDCCVPCLFLDKRFFKEILSMFNNFRGSLEGYEIVEITKGDYVMEARIGIEDIVDDEEYEEIYFEPILDSFALKAKYNKSALKNVSQGNCLN